jgi:hypothetical protein
VSLLWLLPLAAQGSLMGVDELWFHRRRGLPRWERIGHPLDTGTVLICLSVPWLVPLGPPSLWTYAGLSALSCFFVTKDEPVHARLCPPGEHWLHAALFVLHPVVLGVVLLLWSAREAHALARDVTAATGLALPDPALATALLGLQWLLTAAVGLWQALYWARRP